jgi:hypothetical protein
MAIGPSNGETEFFEFQHQQARQEELKSLIEEAGSLGLDGTVVAAGAQKLYNKGMRNLPKPFKEGLGRPLFDPGIQSELDYMIAVLKTTIRKARALNSETDPTLAHDGREKGGA